MRMWVGGETFLYVARVVFIRLASFSSSVLEASVLGLIIDF